MTLPIDLVLVRHGQSEGNVAKRRSEAGDNSVFSPEFRSRHSASFRLSDLGREQAIAAGRFVIVNLWGEHGFDRLYTSEYARAKETAALMDLPSVEWLPEFYLTERDWGDLDHLPDDERQEQFGESLRRQRMEPFFWRPPNGESIANLCMRIDRVHDTLHRECSDKRVIMVCHGEVMRAFRARLERIPQAEFKRALLSREPEDRIHNGEIFHYTRRDPNTGRLAPFVGWLARFRPTEPWKQTVSPASYMKIDRPRYTSKQLLDDVEKIPVMVTG